MAEQKVKELNLLKQAYTGTVFAAELERATTRTAAPGEHSCRTCKGNIEGACVFHRGLTYHKDCFTCHVCSESVLDGCYHVGDRIYCDKHKQEGNPACAKCGKHLTDPYVVGPNEAKVSKRNRERKRSRIGQG